MDNRPIGVFDSGLGGLTAVRELVKCLPQENIVYFGDTGRVPYGTKSRDTICKYTKQDLAFLLSKDVKIIVAACGTVSSNAKHVLQELDIPFLTIVEPSVSAAIAASKNKKVGVIATSATINSRVFERELKSIDNTVEVYSKACPLLVSLVESGFIERDDQVTKLVLERYLEGFKLNGIDTLILGCTHYPILKHAIADVIGSDVKLINSGAETAKQCLSILKELGSLSSQNNSESNFYVSDSVQDFNMIAKICLGDDIGERVTKIDIEKF